MLVDSIRVNPADEKRVLLLKEKQGPRWLPVWMGLAEADAIATAMQRVPQIRPLTHDSWIEVMRKCGAKGTAAVITEVADGLFYSDLVLDVNGRREAVDMQPSDSIAIAVRLKLPILVEDAVLDAAGLTLETAGKSNPITRLLGWLRP